MTVQEAAKAVMKATGHTQAEVAEIAGLSGQGAISVALRSESMRVKSLLQILNACGYELVARGPELDMPEFVIGESVRKQGAFDDAVRRILAEELAKRGPPGAD